MPAGPSASRGNGYWSCVVPTRETAPGPGRSAAESTSVLKVGGMQKMLTSVDGLDAPPVVSAPAGAPVSTMVRARSLQAFTALVGSPLQKAPDVRCPQLVKPVTVEQSAFAVQGRARHFWPDEQFESAVQLAPVGEPLHLRANVLRVLFLQKPQKTFA